MDYKQKYIKYKNKYLILKNNISGGPTANDIFNLNEIHTADDIFKLYKINQSFDFWNLSEESLDKLYLIMKNYLEKESITYNIDNILKYINILKSIHKYKSNEDLLKILILQKYIPVSFRESEESDRVDLNEYSTVLSDYIKQICQKIFDNQFDDIKELNLILIKTIYDIFYEDVNNFVERDKLTIRLPLLFVEMFDNESEELIRFIRANKNTNKKTAIKNIFTELAWKHIFIITNTNKFL